jgi:1-acyl-sn-glycerol-3-phosphate acyltransferase
MNRLLYILRQTAYTAFSFCYFIGLAMDMTVRGLFLLTLGGATDEHKQTYHRMLQRKSRFVINHVPGTSFSYANPTGETFEKPAIIVCNHQSHLDLMAIMMLTPNLIILTKNWVWHNPFYGIIIRYADYFPVTETEDMVRKLERKVEQGYSVMIFPEGTRSEDCSIQRFHRGAFYLAERLRVDIVPVVIKGFGKVLPKTSWHLHPGHMSLEVLPRIRRHDGDDSADGGTGCPSCGYREMTRRVHRMYVEIFKP